MDESCSKWQYVCIRVDNNDVKDTRVQIRKPIIHFSKFKCHAGPPSLPSLSKVPSLSKENLKVGEVFLLSNHPKAKESIPSHQLLHYDIDTKKKSWEQLPFLGEFFLYSSLLRMVGGCSLPLQRFTIACGKSFVRCPLLIAFCL